MGFFTEEVEVSGYNSSRTVKKPRPWRIAGAVSLVIFILVMFLIAYTPVQFGTVKLPKMFGGLTGQVYKEGLHFKIPLIQTTVEYPTIVQSYETSSHPEESEADYTDFWVDAQTSDGQQIDIKYTVIFRLNPENIVDVARNVGVMDAVVENVVKAHSRSVNRGHAQGYEAEDLYSGEGFLEYQDIVGDILTERFAENGVELVDFLLRKISFDPDYVKAIEDQQIAQEKIETERHNAEAAEHQKDQAVWLAQGDKEREILLAEADARRIELQAAADADKIRLLADAEADAIAAKGAALDRYPLITQWEFIQKLATAKWMMLPSDGLEKFLPIDPE